ncbi:hypothetical protein MFLAVUS_000345 [Mucor flavus]|uniref:Choice-of-anchor A domain-containing protein n=1 Tax=Mucor flavus TaxID=439312 RepID=A0ABP9YJG0_9FUNG
MIRVLSLIISALLASSIVDATPADLIATRNLFRRASTAGYVINDQCSSNTQDRAITRRFNGIFFGNFTAGGFRGIVGPLAVQGNFSAPNYNINTLLPATCNGTTSLSSLSWVLGGNTNSFNTQVYGQVLIGGNNSSLEEIVELQDNCTVVENQGTGPIDFEGLRTNREKSSEILSSLVPTQQVLDDGETHVVLQPEDSNYEVFLFHSCQGDQCSTFPKIESNPDGIFFGRGNWKGLQNAVLGSNKTLVFNVPVTNNTTITISTDSPSQGLYTCRVVYNFYPVNNEGIFMPDGTFDIIRNTKGMFGGYILAPRARIFDGDTGYFAGNIVGKEYAWTAYAKVDGDVVGASIDWYVGPSNCTSFTGCIPLHEDYVFPIYVPIPSPVPSSSRIRTQTHSVTRAIETTRTVSSVPFVPQPIESYPNSIAASCTPTTLFRQGPEVTIIVPGSTAVVDIEDGKVTTVTVGDKTYTFIPDVKVITEIDTIITSTTVINGGHTVTDTIHTNYPDHTHEIPNHIHDWECNWGRDEEEWDSKWDDIWDNQWDDEWDGEWDNKWEEGQVDHTSHHRGLDEECNEFDDVDTKDQYKKEW